MGVAVMTNLSHFSQGPAEWPQVVMAVVWSVVRVLKLIFGSTLLEHLLLNDQSEKICYKIEKKIAKTLHLDKIWT